MLHFLRQGLMAAFKQPFAVCILYVYQFAWGILLYKFVQSVVVPLLHRYPGSDQPQSAVHLFLAEGQFRLFKTDLIQPYLWWIILLLGIRMLLSPMLSAGVFYSLEHPNMNAGYRFVKGIRQLLLPFFGFYLLQTLLTLAPLYFLAPKAVHLFREAISYQEILISLLPAVFLYILYAFLIQLFFLFLQFNQTSDTRTGFFNVIAVIMKQGLRIAGNALLIAILGGILAVATTTVSYVWAGFTALIIQQMYPFLRMFLKMWSIAAQHQLWRSSRYSG
ncbi:hypothetical protein [Paenibacillus lutrae]|uniref:Uncharacterized protein n=1 Tax=Paenibacillus lutrae TaxID=2078573 RepID=A0A7X3FMN4_9BACL|nr:hypothetical protein [Paenibacillus lutrae]MVP02540.1 hypothetical protein [Paenibacillus lutrae]